MNLPICPREAFSCSGVLEHLRAKWLRAGERPEGLISYTLTRCLISVDDSTCYRANYETLSPRLHAARSSFNKLPSMPLGFQTDGLGTIWAMTRHVLPGPSQDTALKHAHIQVPPQKYICTDGDGFADTQRLTHRCCLWIYSRPPPATERQQTDTEQRQSRPSTRWQRDGDALTSDPQQIVPPCRKMEDRIGCSLV